MSEQQAPAQPVPLSVWRDPWHFLAFGLGSGTLPKAPGTWGSLIALPFLPLWQLLGAVKAEFGRFGEVLAATKRQIDTVARSIESAETRTRQMARKLKDVEEVGETKAKRLFESQPIEDDSA